MNQIISRATRYFVAGLLIAINVEQVWHPAWPMLFTATFCVLGGLAIAWNAFVAAVTPEPGRCE
jgi:hypothetical protein